MTVEAVAGVEDLENDLDVVGTEKPEIGRVGGEADDLRLSERVARCAEGALDAEATVVQAGGFV